MAINMNGLHDPTANGANGVNGVRTDHESDVDAEVDVLVVGAGPAGLFCANALAMAGVKVRIVDQRPDKVAAGQADGIQPRTMEVLQMYGLLDAFLAQANQLHIAAFYNPAPTGEGIERTHRAPDVTAPTARFPFEATLHQGHIESLFIDNMRKYGVQVDRPVVPVQLEMSAEPKELLDPQAHAVKVTLKRLDPKPDESETEVVRTKYVVGCDGAHSWVRKTLGIEMEGDQTDYVWGVVDLTPDTDFPDIRNRTAIHSENGSCMIIPRERDLVRLYIQLESTDVVHRETGRVDRAKWGPERLLGVAKKSLHPYRIETVGEVDWWTLYIIGQRVASKFSVHERVFIAGDACHTHSPKAGQGMNASMNDSHNLAWKLVQVLRGQADISLLKSYELERRKYAQDLIDFDRKFSALFSSKPRSADRTEGVSHEEFLETFQMFGGFTSGIGIHYAPSTLTQPAHQSFASKLIVGQRVLPQKFVRAADARPFEIQDLLPADTRFKLLVFCGPDMARVQALADGLEGVLSRMRVDREGKGREGDLDVLSVMKGRKEDVEYTEVPGVFRPHWSKVLLDDADMTGKQGGNGYDAYGIGEDGAVVVVRPDGYVGFVASLDGAKDVEEYFAGFLKA